MKTKLLHLCVTVVFLLACAITAPRLEPVTESGYKRATLIQPVATPWTPESDGRKATP